MLKDPQRYDEVDAELAELDDWDYLDPAIAAVANDPRSLLLLTIPKCGTTWLRFLLVNYAVQVARPGAKRIGYGALRNHTIEREMIRTGKRPVRDDIRPFLPSEGLDLLLFQHPRRGVLYRDVAEHGGPKLLAHRNVLDYLVSNYYWFYEYRDNARHLAKRPRDLIDGYVRYWALCWRLFTEKIVPGGRAAIVSYDELQADTAGEITRAFGELGIGVDADALERAIPMASADAAAQDEQRRGSSLVGRIDRGSFVRDGSVGQWSEHFRRSDIDRVASILERCGVNPVVALPRGAR